MLTGPTSYMVNLAFGVANYDQAYALGMLNVGVARNLALLLMTVHQTISYGMFALPLFFMVEKRLGVHGGDLGKKLLPRAVVTFSIYLIAVAFPFIDSINQFLGAVTTIPVTYIIPCLAHLMYFNTAEARRKAQVSPVLSWELMSLLNITIVVVGSLYGVLLGGFITFNSMVKASREYGLFAKCYQCNTVVALNDDDHYLYYDDEV